MPIDWKGVFPALTTKFDKLDNLDLPAFSKNLKAQLDAGIDGIILGGTLGEASVLELDEKETLVKFCVENVDGKVPVVMNIAEGATREAVKQAQLAKKWGANSLLGIDIDAHIHDKKSKQAYIDHADVTARAIMQQYPACETVANTFRFDDDDGINYYASLHVNNTQYISAEFNSERSVDKAGSGDCFMAGLIWSITKKYAPENVIDFAAAAAFGKLHEAGDTTSQTVEQIQSLIKKV